MAYVQSSAALPGAKLKRQVYEEELRRLQAKLCQLQGSVKKNGQRIIIVFEGRDGISHLLSLIPWEPVEQRPVELPARSNEGAYDDEASLKGRHFVPEKY